MEPDDETALRDALGKASIIKTSSSADSPMVIHYDTKLAGEAATHPKQRVPPFKDWHQSRCLKAWMGVRGGCQPDDPLHVADEYIITDGGKAGLMQSLTKLFKTKQHEVRPVTVMYLRNDMVARRERCKDGSVNQIERYYHVTEAIPDKPVRIGTHYGAASDGNAIGMVRLAASDTMMGTPTQKTAIFADGARRWDVGGPGRFDDAAIQETAAKKARLTARGEEVAEPVFWHSPHADFYEDLLGMSGATGLVDFTPGAGLFLLACVIKGTPSLGVCMSQAHLDAVYHHMVWRTLAEMATEGGRLHDPRFAKLLCDHGENNATAATPTVDAPKAKGKAKGKAKAAGGKGKARGKSSAASETHDGADDAIDDEETENVDGDALDEVEGSLAVPNPGFWARHRRRLPRQAQLRLRLACSRSLQPWREGRQGVFPAGCCESQVELKVSNYYSLVEHIMMRFACIVFRFNSSGCKPVRIASSDVATPRDPWHW